MKRNGSVPSEVDNKEKEAPQKFLCDDCEYGFKNTEEFYPLFGLGNSVNISLAMGLGNHQRTGLDLGPSGNLRTDAW